MLLPAALCLCGASLGAVTVDNFVARWFTNAQGVLPYRLFMPTTTPRARATLSRCSCTERASGAPIIGCSSPADRVPGVRIRDEPT